MVRLLVRAGADVNACLTTGISFPAVACAMYDSQQKEADAELLQILIGEVGLCTSFLFIFIKHEIEQHCFWTDPCIGELAHIRKALFEVLQPIMDDLANACRMTVVAFMVMCESETLQDNSHPVWLNLPDYVTQKLSSFQWCASSV